jgi:hypothetical protein
MIEPALASVPAPEPRAEPYAEPYAHFSDELDKLDALLALRSLERNAETPAEQLARALADVRAAQRTIDDRVAACRRVGRLPPLPWLRQRFGLSPLEEQTLVVCLAPELDRKYAAVYAERNAGAALPTVGLVLELLCRSAAEAWRAREVLEDGAPLLQWRLVERTPTSATSGLADTLRLDPGVLRFALGMGLVDPRLLDAATLELPAPPAGTRAALPAPWDDVARLIASYVRHAGDGDEADDGGAALVLHLASDGRGAVDQVRRICGELGRMVLRLDAAALDRRDAELELRLGLALRDSYLRQAPVLLEGLDALPAERATLLVTRTLRAAARLGWLVMLDGGPTLPPAARGDGILWRRIDLPASDRATRTAHWRDALARHAGDQRDAWAGALASRFRFEPAQIADTAQLLALDRTGRPENAPVTLDDCFRICRAQAAPRLGELGRLFAPRYRWADLVLPERRRTQLEAICQSVRNHDTVFGSWGFDQLIHHGRAVSALFVGPPGTGKTMAVEIIAADLGLDICKVDISGVVSKYIGETEQRLATVFREAWAANAVLFFDEADALFGKRTEINDARDRYANIETSYLLQRIEEYEGIVILASNLRDNIDEAFTRRLRFIVEFPSPDDAARLDLWKRHLPPGAPLDAAVDLPALARRFTVSGGSIRNICVRGALRAAEHGTPIAMADLVAAGLEELEKLGRSWVK